MNPTSSTFKSMSLVLLLIITSAPSLDAQSFGVGDKVASLSLGIGGRYTANTSQSPALGLAFEQGVTELGPGVLGVGGYLGYKSLGYKYQTYGYSYDWRYTYLILGVRGAWHYNEWHSSDQWDTYGGLMLAYNIVSVKDDSNYGGLLGGTNAAASSGVGLTGFLGGRYYFNDNFAAHAEVGYGFAVLNIGVSYKF